jgi:hypothetical protein
MDAKSPDTGTLPLFFSWFQGVHPGIGARGGDQRPDERSLRLSEDHGPRDRLLCEVQL